MEIITHPAVLASLIAGLILFQVHRYNNFKSASEKFRSIIFAELEGLYPTPTKWPERTMDMVRILREKFPRIEAAAMEFQGHLSWLNRKRFDKAWRKYHGDYFQYVPMKGESRSYGKLIEKTDTTNTYLSNFKKNVDGLLEFAKPR